MKSATTQMLEKLENAINGQADEAPPGAAEAPRKRVLLIEDEPSTRLVLLQKLRSAGFDVDVAVNGKLALEKIHKSHPDAIFMDLLLPEVKGLKGVDVIKAARRDPQFSNRPIYVCTSAALMSVWTRRGTKAGATKVFDRACTPIDTIVAELATDLLGHASGAQPSKEASSEHAEPEDKPEVPTPSQAEIAGAGASQQLVTQVSDPQLSAAKSPVQPLTFMKRFAKTLGLDWTRRAGGESGTTTGLDPTQPVQDAEAASGTEPAADPVQNQPSSSDSPAPLESEPRHAEADPSQLDGLNLPANEHGVAVLTLDEGARILSANKTCTSMFGWEGAALIGQDLKILLKDGAEDDIGKLLQQQRAGDQNKVACPLLTVARRKDGTEFPVSVTTLTWSSDTTLMRRAQAPQFCWTAFIRDMAASADSQTPAATEPAQAHRAQSAESLVPAAEITELQERFAALQKGNEDLQQQLLEITTEAALRHEELTKREQEREELTSRVFESEVELNRARTDLEKESGERKQLEQKLQELRAELGKQTEERGRLESEWREQLKCAESLTKKLETGWLEEASRNKSLEERLQIFGNSLKLEQAERSRRFEEEVLALRQERDALYGKLTEEQLATEDVKRRVEALEARLRDSNTEAAHIKAELEKQTAEQKRLESEWRETLSTAESLSSKLEAAWVDAEAHNKRTEEELTSLRQVRDDLKSKLAGEQRATAESSKRNDELAARVLKNAVEMERVRVELEKVGRNAQFEEQLNGLEQAREALNGELQSEQQVSAESRQRTEELENRLRENAAELERVKAEADQHAEEQARLESALHSQLDAANAAAGQAEAALKEKSAQCSEFETKLATLEKVRDELGGKLATEQKAGAESRQRSEELENRLNDSAAELERVKAEHEKQAEEQARLESELREQLDAARAAAGAAEAALNEQAAQNKGFEERLRLFGNSLRLQQIENNERFESELTSLQQVRDELGNKLTAEQQATAEAKRRSEELGNQLRQTAAELERVQADLAGHAKERAQLEAEQNERLNTAKAATEKAETAWQAESERSKRFEADLAGLREEREQLRQKFTAEQQAVVEARRHGEELEIRLRETTAELERVHTELTRHAEERSHLESRESAQIHAGKLATEKAEAAWLEEAERSKQFEEELAALRQERDQLHQKFAAEQHAVADSRRHSAELEDRLSETVAGLARVRTELAQHEAERARSQSEHLAQLNMAKAATEQAEAALTQKAALCIRLQEEAASLWRESEELSARLAAEQVAAAEFKRRGEEFENRLRENAAELETTKASLHQQGEEQKRLEAELREQLNTAQGSATRAEEALKEGAARQRQLERSMTNLRNEHHQVYDKFKSEHALVEKSKRRIGELEKRLRERATELQRARSELEKQAAEGSRQESEWRAQLEMVRSMTERELGGLRQQRQTLQGQLTTEQQVAAELRQRSEEFERRLQEGATELERVRAELEQLGRDRHRLESEHRSFAETRNALGRELQHLRESEAAHQADVLEMEGRLAENIALLARVTSELETERGERQRIEQRAASLAAEMQELHKELEQHLGSEQANEQKIAGLMQQLREREEAVTKVSMDLQREMVNRQAAEEQLRATAALSDQLRNHLTLIEEAKQVFASRETDLESRLQASLDALRETESSARKESSERRRLEEALQEAQRESQRLNDSNALELSKLKSAMQVEQLQRKGLEAQAIQSRYSSLNSSRVGAAMVNNFRDRLRQPVDKLMQSARQLLEVPIEDEHKKLVESMLENALLLQTSVRESGTSNADPSTGARGENPRGSNDPRQLGLVFSEANGGLQP
jgi:chromosome segregation ATPase/CheY-like chemotaxis protein